MTLEELIEKLTEAGERMGNHTEVSLSVDTGEDVPLYADIKGIIYETGFCRGIVIETEVI